MDETLKITTYMGDELWFATKKSYSIVVYLIFENISFIRILSKV